MNREWRKWSHSLHVIFKSLLQIFKCYCQLLFWSVIRNIEYSTIGLLCTLLCEDDQAILGMQFISMRLVELLNKCQITLFIFLKFKFFYSNEYLLLMVKKFSNLTICSLANFFNLLKSLLRHVSGSFRDQNKKTIKFTVPFF